MKLGGKNKHKSKIGPDITGHNQFSLVELGGGGVIRKNDVFVTYERVIRS